MQQPSQFQANKGGDIVGFYETFEMVDGLEDSSSEAYRLWNTSPLGAFIQETANSSTKLGRLNSLEGGLNFTIGSKSDAKGKFGDHFQNFKQILTNKINLD